MTPPSYALEITDAHKRFDTVQALDGIGIHLQGGEWLALLGPNGAGKTTLVRSVSGRLDLDRGTIILDGVLLDQSQKAREARKKLGIVTEDIALYPLLTAKENLEIWGTLHGLSGKKLKDKALWALDWTGLEERGSKIVKNYSNGMKRRLNIACSMLHEPKVLLMDEPTVGVDPQSRQRIWEMLNELGEQKVSMLWTTHQLEEAQHLCHRIVIIDYGRVIANGTFEELVQQTIGPHRRVTLHLEEPVPDSLHMADIEITNESTLCRKMGDIAGELPAFLDKIHKAGAKVRELSIDAPSLQEVFIHLTGRELRE